MLASPEDRGFMSDLETLKSLQLIWHKLNTQKQQSLLEFAEFLYSQQVNEVGAAPAQAVRKRDIPRPEQETVVAAIKRLRKTYPMLDARPLLSGASQLMSEHVMQGRSANNIIDELEQLFAEHFAEFENAVRG